MDLRATLVMQYHHFHALLSIDSVHVNVEFVQTNIKQQKRNRWEGWYHN